MNMYEYSDNSIIDIAHFDNVFPSNVLDLSTISFSLAKEQTTHIASSLHYDVHYTPPKHYLSLYNSIANVEGVEPSSLLLASSIAECIFYTLAVIAPEKVLLVGPLSSEYARICRVLSIPYIVYPLTEEYGYSLTEEDIQSIRSYHPTLTVFCTPNTITGSVFPIALALHAISSPWIIVDTTLKEYMYKSNHYDDLYWNKLYSMATQGTHLVTIHECAPFFCSDGSPMAYIITKQEQHSLFANAFPKQSSIPLYTQKLYTACYSSIQSYRECIPVLERNVNELIHSLQQYTIFTAFYSTLSLGFTTCELHEDINPSLFYSFLRKHNILVYWCIESTGSKANMFRIRYLPNAITQLCNVLDSFIETL